MKALCWHGRKDIRCDDVDEPRIEHPRDAIVKVTTCAICGHEFMGEVVEVGAENRKLRVGERVVVPFTIEQMRGAARAKKERAQGPLPAEARISP